MNKTNMFSCLTKESTPINVKIISLIAIGICLVVAVGHSQERPFVKEYTPQDYKADNQNWAITQTTNKDIFVANNKGLLQYNGTRWKFYDSPNNTTIRAVMASGDKVYSGAYMDFGVWKKNNSQGYEYESLTDSIPLKEDEQFWGILELDKDLIAFQSLDRVYILNLKTKSYHRITSRNGINKIYNVNHTLYYQKVNEGIYKFVNGQEILVSNRAPFRHNLVVNLYYLNHKLYGQTQNNGIFSLKNGTSYQPINQEELWNNISVYNSIQTKDGTLYLGTIAHGLLKLKNKKIIYQIDKEKGLSNNTVLSLFQDQNKNIWLGLDNGIDYISTNSSLKVYHDYKGLLGTVYATIEYNGTLYVGTNQGLYYYKSSEKRFKRIPGTSGQVWSFFKTDHTLFCGHNNGTYIIKDTTAKLIADIQGTWNFKKYKDYIVQGNYNGLHLLKKVNGHWEYYKKIKGFNNSSKYFEFSGTRDILVNHEYKGIYRLHLNKDFDKVLFTQKISSAHKGLYSSLINFQGQILYAYEKGIYKYLPDEKTFIKDTTLSKLYNHEEYVSGKLIKDPNGHIWTFTKNDIVRIAPSTVMDQYQIVKYPIPNDIRSQITGDENISLINGENYLFGTTKGFFSLNTSNFKSPQPTVKIYDVFKTSKDTRKRININEEKDIEIPYSQNNIEFYFSSTGYYPFYKTEYQHKLAGYENTWSKWTTHSQVDFKNLNYGDYTLNVRSRIGTANVSPSKSVSFMIKRPFLLSYLMLLLYGLGFVIIVFTVHFLYRNHYRQKQEKQARRAEQELKFKEHETQRKLVQIRNEKLNQDIESKNNDLAISTMSLIKKNEFLSHIKSELSIIDVADSKIKQVIKTIDKNINSSDDWKFFEEAFNNADKDFFRKVKKTHSALTPDDLKLCAYLRLNLSSKEIAPLFNISTKSVEVKRYRLRKKMNLRKEQNLVAYILSI